MALSCVLGITACLSFGGQQIPARDAITILDTCDLMRGIPAQGFIGPGMGVVAAEKIEGLSVELTWPAGATARRQSFLTTCASFERAFNNKALWSNLDKWRD
jgi:hypothetical protein